MKPTERVEAQKWYDYDENTFVVTASLALEHATKLERVQNLYSESCRLGEEAMRNVRQENADLKRQVEELKAEVEKVNSFREQLRAKHHQTGFTLYEINEQNAQITAENDQLRAQLAEATKDKERLDWLGVSEEGCFDNLADVYFNYPKPNCKKIRQAIDAAIEAQKGKQ